MIDFEIVREQERITEYRDDWNQLFDSGDYEASTSYEWCKVLLETHLIKNDEMVLVLIKDDGKIIGIIPVILSIKRKYGQSIRYLFPVSEYYNTHSDILIKQLSDEPIKVFFNAIFSLRSKWDVIIIQRLIEWNPLVESIRNYCNYNSIKYFVRKEQPSYFITLPGHLEEYLRKRSRNFRRSLIKNQRKLYSLGEIRIEKVVKPEEMEQAFDKILRIEESSWKGSHGTSIKSVWKQYDFYRRLCRAVSQKGWIHLQFLLMNNDPVAYNMGLIIKKRYFYLKTSFDERYREYSPSMILRVNLIEELIKRNINEIDFTAEPYEWQKRWSEEYRWHKSLTIYNNTIKARLHNFYNFVNARLEDRKGNGIKFANPMDLRPYGE